MEPTDQRSGDIPADTNRAADLPEDGTFPKNVIVGVFTDRAQLVKAIGALRAAGFEPGVLYGEEGEKEIRQGGDIPRETRLHRFVQGLFGFEAEHSRRHMEEIEAGNFLLFVESHDDETTEKAAPIYRNNGARFVNFYSEWTNRALVP